jgi:7,8-dihydropterin-6-yl-methyl-4-(beta-D-ribofuranosyl)aminobenzene 5'-phosphate synthase
MLDRLTVTVLAEDHVPYESPLLGQHGLSLWLEAERKGKTGRFLVDLGQNPEALLHNAELLRIPLNETDGVILTHCHYDHTRGLARILRAIGRKDLPVIAHPTIFRLNFAAEPTIRHFGVALEDGPEEIRDAGGLFFPTRDPLTLMDGLTTTGEVPRVTDFEVTEGLWTLDGEGRVRPDRMEDDLSLVAELPKGLVILTGCAHAGIVNILRRARDLAGEAPLAGILGGLHLVEAKEERIRLTVEALRAFSPDLAAAGHCTGFRAQSALSAALGERFVPLGAGKVFSF